MTIETVVTYVESCAVILKNISYALIEFYQRTIKFMLQRQEDDTDKLSTNELIN